MQARGGEPGSSGGGGQPASVGSEAPSQGLPQGQRDSLAPGRVCCPHAGKGALTQPSQAHRAAVPGSLPVAWERRWVPGAGCSVPARQERWDTFPRSTADRPGQPAVHGPLLRLPPPPAPGQAPAPSSPKPWPGAQLGPGTDQRVIRCTYRNTTAMRALQCCINGAMPCAGTARTVAHCCAVRSGQKNIHNAEPFPKMKRSEPMLVCQQVSRTV